MGVCMARSWAITKLNCILAFCSIALCWWRILSRPQILQRYISLWSPLPHDLQGTGIFLSLRILARWILQYSHRQFFPQTLVSPTLSQAHWLWPFMILVRRVLRVYYRQRVCLNEYSNCDKLSGLCAAVPIYFLVGLTWPSLLARLFTSWLVCIAPLHGYNLTYRYEEAISAGDAWLRGRVAGIIKKNRPAW